LGIEGTKDKKLLYHLTKVDNFRSIVQYGLLPRRVITSTGIKYTNVANNDIISKRCELGLDCYIPFHFHPYSAFDVAVKNKYGAQRMMYICVFRDYARAAGFKILPKHPLSLSDCELYDYDIGFEMIDWDALTCTDGYSEDAKEIKMAECLTDQVISVNSFACLFVPSEEVKGEVCQILDEECVEKSIKQKVLIQEIWFKNYGCGR